MVDSTQTNISLITDFSDSTFSLERLRRFTPQNFTSLLNNPNVTLPYLSIP
jgi:hypothetical protein